MSRLSLTALLLTVFLATTSTLRADNRSSMTVTTPQAAKVSHPSEAIGDHFVNVLIRQLEAEQGDRRANVMAAPKLTMFNGQLPLGRDRAVSAQKRNQ